MDESRGNSLLSRLIEWKVATTILLAEIFVMSGLFCYGILYSGFVMKEHFRPNEALGPIVLYICFSSISYPWQRFYCKQFYQKMEKLKLRKIELIISTIGLIVSFISSGLLQNLFAQCLFFGICGGIFSGILAATLQFYCENVCKWSFTIYSSIIQLSKLISFGLVSMIFHFINNNFGPFITQLIWGCCTTNLILIILALDANLDPQIKQDDDENEDNNGEQESIELQERETVEEQIELATIDRQIEQASVSRAQDRDTGPNTGRQSEDDAIEAEIDNDSEEPILDRDDNRYIHEILWENCQRSLRIIRFYPLLITNVLNLFSFTIYLTTLPYIFSKEQYYDVDNFSTTGTLIVPLSTSITWCFFIVSVLSVKVPQQTPPNYLFVTALLSCTFSTIFLLKITKVTAEMCCLPYGGANAILMFYDIQIFRQFIGNRNWQICKHVLTLLTGISILIIYIVIYYTNFSIFSLIKCLPLFYCTNLFLWSGINYRFKHILNPVRV